MQWPDLGSYGLDLDIEDGPRGQRLALRSRDGRAVPVDVSKLGFSMVGMGHWAREGLQLTLAELQALFPRVRVADLDGGPSVRDADPLRPLRDAMRRGYGPDVDVDRYRVAEPASGTRVRARAMQQLLGVETVWMRYDGEDPRLEFAGVTLRRRQDRTVYLNVDGPFAAAATLGHEAVHVMRREQPVLYADLVATLRPLIDQPAFGRYAARLNHGNAGIDDRLLSQDELREEAVADIVGDMLLDDRVWGAIDDRHLVQRLLEFLQAFLQRLTERWRFARPELDKTLGSRELLRDIDAARDAVIKTLTAWRDAGRNAPVPVGSELAVAFRLVDGAAVPEIFPESAIRDETGGLQVVYRGEWGPPADHPFDATRSASPTFTASPDVAAVYATGSDAGRTNARVRACVLDIRRPLQLGSLLEDVVDFGQLRDALIASGEVSDGEVREAWANVDGYLRHYPRSELAKPVQDQECEAFSRYSHAEADIADDDYTDTYAIADDEGMRALAVRAGYDGYIYQGTFTSPDLFDRPLADCIAAGYDHTCSMAVEYRPFHRDQVRHVFSDQVPTALRTTSFRKDFAATPAKPADAGDGRETVRREIAHYVGQGMDMGAAKARVTANQRQQAVELRAQLSEAYKVLRNAEQREDAHLVSRARARVHDLRWALRDADRAIALLSSPTNVAEDALALWATSALRDGDVAAAAPWLDWNMKLGDQPKAVQSAIRVLGLAALAGVPDDADAVALFEGLETSLGSAENASASLMRAGICGVRYHDANPGTENAAPFSKYVVWNSNAVHAPSMRFQRVFHGTPHRFEQFDTAHVGTGEGAQAYGWGMYFAQREDVARFYANRLSADHSRLEGVGEQLAGRVLAQVGYDRTLAVAALADGRDVVGGPVAIEKANAYVDAALSKITRGEGQVYAADVPNDAALLDWDAKMTAQPADVRAKLEACDFNGNAVIAAWKQNGAWPHVSGETLYRHLAGGLTYGAAAEGRHREASLLLQSIGIPGLRYLDAGSRGRSEDATCNYVIWDDRVIDRMAPAASMQFRREEVPSEEPFYSALLHAIERGRGAPKSAPAEAWRGWLDGAQRRGECRQAERDWLSVDAWLQAQPLPVTRDALAAYVRANQVRIQEVLLGHDTEGGRIGGTRHAKWAEPGGERYRELLLTLPLPAAEFTTSHFNYTNILAHVRFDERISADGRRVLFLEEIQSDWHQRGRKEGYVKGPESIDTLAWTYSQVGQDHYEVFAGNGDLIGTFQAQGFVHAREQAVLAQVAGGVPDAPFKGTDEWVTLVLKRVVRWAAEHGFDGMAWTGGEQQVERYSIGGKVSEATVQRTGDGWQVGLLSADGRWIREGDTVSSVEELTRYLGKDAAAKAQSLAVGEECDFAGMDREFGGEGMRTFYDRVVPQTIGKWLRAFGAAVEDLRIEMATEDDDRFEVVLPNGKVVSTTQTRAYAEGSARLFEGAEVRELDLTADRRGFWLTPALRAAALDGLPLFRRKQAENVIYLRDTSGNLVVQAKVSPPAAAPHTTDVGPGQETADDEPKLAMAGNF